MPGHFSASSQRASIYAAGLPPPAARQNASHSSELQDCAISLLLHQRRGVAKIARVCTIAL